VSSRRTTAREITFLAASFAASAFGRRIAQVLRGSADATSRGEGDLAVWNRKGASRDASAQVLERLEWFNRPELEQPEPVAERPAAAEAPTRAAEPVPELLLPVPPWQTDESAAPAPEASAPPAVAPPPFEPAAVERPRPSRPPMRVYRRPLRTVGAGVLALALSVGFIVAASSLRSSDSKTSAAKPRPAAIVPTKPAAQPQPAKPKAAKPKPVAKPKPTAKPKPAPVIPATLPPFAWSPVAGASAYDFQLFRGSKLVFSKRTAQPGITVPSTWTSRGRFVRLGPGSYRWYVWAIVGGARSERAVVQAKLELPG
jgi:hypothetical protein